MNTTNNVKDSYVDEMRRDREIASKLVTQLAQISDRNSLDDYLSQLVRLGDAAVRPLKEFIASEEINAAARFDSRDFRDYSPNYFTAKTALSQIIMQSESCIYIG